MVGNVATLPEKASGMKNFALTEMMRRHGVDTIGLTQPDRRWDVIPDEDHFDERFRGHFPSQQIRATVGCNRHDAVVNALSRIWGEDRAKNALGSDLEILGL